LFSAKIFELILKQAAKEKIYFAFLLSKLVLFAHYFCIILRYNLLRITLPKIKSLIKNSAQTATF
jgi:hypothetical protein